MRNIVITKRGGTPVRSREPIEDASFSDYAAAVAVFVAALEPAPPACLAFGSSTSACLKSSSKTSERVGWAWTLNLRSWIVWLVATALEASWIRSAACRPMIQTPRISPVSFL